MPLWFNLTMYGLLLGATWLLGTPAPALTEVVEVPLLRSPDDPRPKVLVEIGGVRWLAVVDLAGGPTRVGWGPVYGADLKTRRVQGPAGSRTLTVVPEVVVGGLVLTDLRAEVRAGDDLVLGLGALSGIEAAIVTSEGVVRFGPPDGGVVAGVGAAVPRDPQPLAMYRDPAGRRVGDGASARVPATLIGVDGVATGGLVGLRTDLTRSVIASRLGGESHGGMPTASVRATLGGADLPWVTARADERHGDPAPDWVGALGHDALAGLDLAVGAGSVAWSVADLPTWTDLGDAAVGLESLPADRSTASWLAGSVEAALTEAEEAATGTATCHAWWTLGARRLRAGSDQALGPLEEAMNLWNGWVALSPEDRVRARQGRRVPEDQGEVQPDACAASTGWWLLARLASGETVDRLVADGQAYDVPSDPLVAQALGVALLRAGRPDEAEPWLRSAWQRGGERSTWLALAAALVARGRSEEARLLVDRAAWDDPNPLLTAVIAGRLGLDRAGDGPERDGFAAREVVRLASNAAVDRARLDRALADARVATADACWVVAARRVVARGDGAGVVEADAGLERWEARCPDVWAARLLDPDPEVAAVAGAVLATRFPEWFVP